MGQEIIAKNVLLKGVRLYRGHKALQKMMQIDKAIRTLRADCFSFCICPVMNPVWVGVIPVAWVTYIKTKLEKNLSKLRRLVSLRAKYSAINDYYIVGEERAEPERKISGVMLPEFCICGIHEKCLDDAYRNTLNEYDRLCSRLYEMCIADNHDNAYCLYEEFSEIFGGLCENLWTQTCQRIVLDVRNIRPESIEFSC